MPAPGLFGKDAAYWQSVHQTGEGLEKEKQAAAKAEKEAWQAKVLPFSNFTTFLLASIRAPIHMCCAFQFDCENKEAAKAEKGAWQAKVLPLSNFTSCPKDPSVPITFSVLR